MSFELYEEYDIRTFFKSLKLVALAESLGAWKALCAIPHQ